MAKHTGIPATLFLDEDCCKIVGRHIHEAANLVVEKYPELTKLEFTAIMRACTNYIEVFDSDLTEEALHRQNVRLDEAFRTRYIAERDRCTGCQLLTEKMAQLSGSTMQADNIVSWHAAKPSQEQSNTTEPDDPPGG
jgi:hypothetical protein